MFSIKTYRSSGEPRLSSRTDSQKLLHIGFRTIELVEDKDGGEISEGMAFQYVTKYICVISARGRTFYFRVNGHPIFMKGVNYVPAQTLPELSAETETCKRLTSI